MGLRVARLGRGRYGWTLWTVAGVAALALLSVGAFVYSHRAKPTASTSRATTATVRRGTVTVSEAAAGTVQATSTRGLSFSMSGTVTKVSVKAGDSVTAGQVLATIDNSDAADAVSAAESALATASQALTDAESSASSSPTANTNTGCQAAAAYQVATSRVTTSPTPSPSATASAKPSPTSKATSARPKSAPTQAKNCATSQSGNGSRAGGTDSLYSAQQQYNNAELALAQARRNLDGTVITAPVSGRVLAVNGTVGTNETPGSTAFITTGAVADTQVQAQFSEADVAGLAVGQSATIKLASHPDSYVGKVSQISPAGTVSSQLVRYTVMIAFDDPPSDVLYGQSANVTVTTGSASDVLYVSSSAVTVSGGHATVTVRGDGVRTVQIGLRGDQYTEIRSGLSDGDVLVVPDGG
jgi:HlyD family secretion protein